MMKEEKLIKLFNACDNQAFELIFHTFHKSLCFFVGKIVQDNDVACDIVQDIFITTWNNNLKFENASHLKSFLYKSAKNKALNHLEKVRIREAILMKNDFQIDVKEEIIVLYEVETNILEQIYLAIEELPLECSRIFRMSYLENLDVKTISDKLGIASSTIMTQRQRAKKYLRDKFKDSKFILLYIMSI